MRYHTSDWYNETTVFSCFLSYHQLLDIVRGCVVKIKIENVIIHIQLCIVYAKCRHLIAV